MKQARAAFAWHQRRDADNNLHQTQTTVEIKVRNVLLLWVYQQERTTHAETYMTYRVGRREKRKDWLGGIQTRDTGKRGEVIMSS
jgi:hypothetical protein